MAQKQQPRKISSSTNTDLRWTKEIHRDISLPLGKSHTAHIRLQSCITIVHRKITRLAGVQHDLTQSSLEPFLYLALLQALQGAALPHTFTVEDL